MGLLALLSPPEPELSIDERFHLLSNPRRLELVRFLDGVDGPVPMDELAEVIAARENDTEPRWLTDQERKRVYVSLYQTHLPRMEAAGVIERSPEFGEIEPGPRLWELTELVDMDDRGPIQGWLP